MSVINKKTCPLCFEEMQEQGACNACGCNVQALLNKYPFALPHFTVLKNRYVVGGVIGAGGFGITYVCLDNTDNTKYAIKEFFPSEIATRTLGNTNLSVSHTMQEEKNYGMTRFYDEANVLSSVSDCKAIAHVYDVFKENLTAYMVMEYIDGGSLKQLQNKYNYRPPFIKAQEVFVDLCMTLSVIHAKNLLHRDISPDNILFDRRGTARLIDFGAARFVMRERDKSLSVVLKKGYAPPEQYSSHGNQGAWTDIYALACTMYSFMAGKPVPDSMDRLSANVLVTPLCEVRDDVSKDFSDILVKAMQLDYKKRYSSTLEMLEDAAKCKEFGANKNSKPAGNMPSVGRTSFKPRFFAKKAASYIQIIKGSGKGRCINLEAGKIITIGADKTQTLFLPEYKAVNAQHCIISYVQGRACISDISINGTFFADNTRLKKGVKYYLNNKEKIHLGNKDCVLKINLV